MNLTRRIFLATAAASVAVPARAAGVQRLGGLAFGSYWRLTLPEGADGRAAEAALSGIVARIDAAMSPYRAESELSRCNRLGGADPIPLSEELAFVTRAALDCAAETGGAFDPTVGPIVARYGFGPIRGQAGGYQGLTLDGAGLGKAEPGLTLDLCGIAKGHALDRIVAAIGGQGLGDFAVELGGEVAVRGAHPEGRSWRIAVEGVSGGLARICELGGSAVATSGDAAQGYRLGGHAYGHVVDPGAGGPADGSLAAVSVFHASAMRADALATALFAMGRERAQDFAEARGIEALLTAPDGSFAATGGAEARILAEVAR